MKSKILIIDDEENICFGFELILTDQGYDVMTATDYGSALKCLSRTEPDLVITDIILGGHTGIDLLHEIKNRELLCPVIMITGEPNVETATEAVRLGAFDYIPKPIRKDTLLRITGLALQHKNLLDNKKRLEQDNLRVRRNMEAIFRSLKDGIITVNHELQVIAANESAKRICRFSVKDIIGQHFDTIQTGCSRSCRSALNETLTTRKTIGEFRVECRHPDQPLQVVLLTGSPLRYDDADTIGAVLVVRDITRLTNLELQLKSSHQFHESIRTNNRMQDKK